MSETIIFAIGAVIFAVTVWGSVMAGGIWLGRVQEAEDPTGRSNRGNVRDQDL